MKIKMIDTAGGHYAIILKTKKKQDSNILYLEDKDLGVLFLEDKEGDLCSFKTVRKVHKVNCHKRKEQLIAAYRNTGWMSPELLNVIHCVVNDCKVCQKFGKSVARPRVFLSKSTSFNKIVTLDLKEFGSKCMLWMIDYFTRFIQEKLISNKKEDMIINTLTDSWCMNIGFPSHGFFAEEGSEFSNINLDELTSKLGLSVKFGP